MGWTNATGKKEQIVRNRCGEDKRHAIRASVRRVEEGGRRDPVGLYLMAFCTAAILLVATSCRTSATRDGQSLLAPHKGQILVLLLGAPGCPGTGAATEFLNGYVKERPEGVDILRLDVPTPGGGLAGPEEGIAIPRQVDRDRQVARKLEFFFYPTLYLLDRDGVVRFAGGCEPDKVRAMVKELVAEKPGAEKKMFTPPLLPVGQPMPAFSGRTLAGEEKTLDDLKGAKATFLLFGATSCPYSNQALEALPQVLRDYAPKGVALAVVTRGPATDETRRIHDEKAPGITVLSDPADEIGLGLCRVPAVPFFYVLDAAGNVSARQPFTDAGARAALDATLGLAPAKVPASASGAG